MLDHVQPAVSQHPQVLLPQATFQPCFPQLGVLHGIVVTQVQDLELDLVEPHTVCLGPAIQPVQIALQSIPALQQINTSTQAGVICELAEGAPDPLV